MLFNGNRTLPVTEYTNVSITRKGAHAVAHNTVHPNFSFNGWELADAIARTICSQHLNNREYWADFISSLLGLNLIIHSNQPNARLSSSRINLLRDFSRTGRVGEIAQGLTYLYLRKQQGYSIINDFEFFCISNNINIPASTSTPDFVAQNSMLNTDVCLAESKGTETMSSTNIKGKLAKSMSQCSSGEAILNAEGTYNVIKKLGFCFELSDELDVVDSKLHFVDPENPPKQSSENYMPLRLHYASWFYMVGDFKNVDRLLNDEPIKWNPNYYHTENINGEEYWFLYRLPKSVFELLGDAFFVKMYEFYFFRFWSVGISFKVIQMLQDKSYSQLKEFKFQNESMKRYEIFSDGTALLKID